MKKLMLLLAVLLTATTAFGQETAKKGKGKPTVEVRAQRSVDKLDKVVTLTADQKPKVYDLSLARAKKHDEIRDKYKGQPDKKELAKSEAKANHKEYRAAVKALLTEEQITKLKAHHKAKKDARAAKGKKPVKIDEQPNMDDVENMIPVED